MGGEWKRTKWGINFFRSQSRTVARNEVENLTCGGQVCPVRYSQICADPRFPVRCVWVSDMWLSIFFHTPDVMHVLHLIFLFFTHFFAAEKREGASNVVMSADHRKSGRGKVRSEKGIKRAKDPTKTRKNRPIFSCVVLLQPVRTSTPDSISSLHPSDFPKRKERPLNIFLERKQYLGKREKWRKKLLELITGQMRDRIAVIMSVQWKIRHSFLITLSVLSTCNCLFPIHIHYSCVLYSELMKIMCEGNVDPVFAHYWTHRTGTSQCWYMSSWHGFKLSVSVFTLDAGHTDRQLVPFFALVLCLCIFGKERQWMMRVEKSPSFLRSGTFLLLTKRMPVNMSWSEVTMTIRDFRSCALYSPSSHRAASFPFTVRTIRAVHAEFIRTDRMRKERNGEREMLDSEKESAAGLVKQEAEKKYAAGAACIWSSVFCETDLRISVWVKFCSHFSLSYPFPSCLL